MCGCDKNYLITSCSLDNQTDHVSIPSHSVVSDSCDPVDCSLPCSSVHGIFQARILFRPYTEIRSSSLKTLLF